jgi:hypothetical protein
MSSRYSLLLLFLAILLAACSQDRRSESIGEAFVGPATLNLRKELAQHAQVTATVKHGERLWILQTRRRFVEVRTEKGAVGWTDSRLLLSPGQMQELHRMAEASKTMLSQGTASVYDLVNVHTEPSRSSPSFTQIPENGTAEVIGHKLAPRISAPAVNTLITQKKAPAAKRASAKAIPKDSKRMPRPPMPSPPKPPDNWLELSETPVEEPEPGQEPAAAPVETAAEKPVPMEDWSMVRLKDNRVGWVLSRMIYMAIPDEVAQYAEGHRISSYFALSDIPDQGQTKHAWLWTTIAARGVRYDFDGLRVFTWSTRRHRYETVYRERNLTGYYPVEAQRTPNGATFSVIVDDNGSTVRKTYAFNGYRVNLINKVPYTLPRDETQAVIAAAETPKTDHRPGPSWYARIKTRVRSLFR